MRIGRGVLGIAAGVVAAGAIIALTEAAGHAALSGDGAFGAAVVGYGLGALAGTAVTTRVSGKRSAAAVPVVLAGLAAINLFTFPHPNWFAPTAVMSLVLGWWLASGARARTQRSG